MTLERKPSIGNMIKRTFAVAALIVAMAILSGCGADRTNRAGYDELVAGSKNNMQAEVIFDIPYKELVLSNVHCDTGYIIAPLVAVYGKKCKIRRTCSRSVYY